MKPHRSELRSQILAACDANQGTRAVALQFRRSESWVRLIKQQRRVTGQVAPKTVAPRQPMWHASLTICGPVIGPLFRGGVEQHLVSEVKHCVLEMVNLLSHKVVWIREAVQRAGAELRSMAPYSPDLAHRRTLRSSCHFSKLKKLRREGRGTSTKSGSSAVLSSISSTKTRAETASSAADTALCEMESLSW